MNDTSPYSATIERMRIARNVPTAENRHTWTPAPAPNVPPPIKIHPRLRQLRKAIRRFMGLRDVTEIQAVIEDIQVLLVRCGLHLQSLQAERQWRRAEAKRAWRNPHLQLLKRRRGRPTDGVNFAYHQLGLELAMIWFTFTGHRPTRRFDAIGDGGEIGPFRNFVAAVLAILPTRLRMKRKGHMPRVDAFVRASVEACKEALVAPDAYRRLGLLDERRWLNDLPRATGGEVSSTA